MCGNHPPPQKKKTMLEGLKMLQYFFKVYPAPRHKEDEVPGASWGPAAAWSPFMAILEINILRELIFFPDKQPSQGITILSKYLPDLESSPRLHKQRINEARRPRSR